MYRILIVDDEPLIANGMQRVIERLDFFKAEKAFSGPEAMDRLACGDIDAILLDINMPGMSGLELLKRLSERGEVPLTVIISGYDKFDFAKQAMTAGAMDYLLKPVSPRDVAAICRRIYEKLEAARRVREEDQKLREFVSSQRDVIKQRLLADILNGSVDRAFLQQFRHFYGFDLRGEYYTVAVVRISRTNYTMDELEFQTAIARVYTQIKQIFEKVPEAILFNMENACFVLIISATEPFDVMFLDALLGQAADALEPIQGIEAFIGRGEEVYGLGGVEEAYQSALDAMDYKAMSARERKNHGAAHKVWEHVKAHYAESDLSVNSISSALGYSPNYLGNAFKREYGDSINDFINRCRVKAAAALIRGTDRRIYDIAFTVGFNDDNYFSRIFKRYAGCSPSDYRNGEEYV